jgi:hypothetical protein
VAVIKEVHRIGVKFLVQLTLDHFIDRKDLVSDRESDQTTSDIGRLGTFDSNREGIGTNDKRKRRK